MPSIHSREDVREVCTDIVEREGIRVLTRARVQDELRKRGQRIHGTAAGAHNATVGAVISEARERLRRAEATGAQPLALSQPASALSSDLRVLLDRQTNEIEQAFVVRIERLRQAERAEADARVELARLEAAEHSTAIQEELGAVQRDYDALLAEHDVVLAKLDASRDRIVQLGTAATEREAALDRLRHESSSSIIMLTGALYQAHDAQSEATKHATVARSELARVCVSLGEAEQRSAKAEREVARLRNQLRECSEGPPGVQGADMKGAGPADQGDDGPAQLGSDETDDRAPLPILPIRKAPGRQLKPRSVTEPPRRRRGQSKRRTGGS